MNLSDSIYPQVKILVVDEHPHTAELLARVLSQLDPRVNVVSALSCQQALDFAEKEGIDILITDMNMPEMTGLELIEEFQKRPAGGPTFSFLLTARHVPGMKIEARRLHVREVLYKPIPPQKICGLVRQAIQEMDQRESRQEFEGQKKRFKILIADDESAHATLLSRFVESEGYAFVTAQDGLETLERIYTELPDLILLDVNMPNKDGLTVLQELRANPATQNIPAIILSAAWISATEIHDGLNLAPEDFLTKPIDRRELLARIRRKLKEALKLDYERSPE